MIKTRCGKTERVPVLLLIVGLVVLAVTVYVAMGRGGELSAERADYAPLDLGPVSAADVALLRPPSNGWGYNKAATDEALVRIAESVRERDVRIVALEQLVTDLSRDPAPVALGEPLPGARHRREMETAEPRALDEAGTTAEPETPGGAERGYDTVTEAPEAEAPEAEASEAEGSEAGTPVSEAAREEKPAETTLPQRAVSSESRVWPTTPGLPPVTWPKAPAAADAAAEDITAPQPAVRDQDREPEQQRVRERGGQPERRPQEPRNQEPPPERSHG